MALPQMEVYHFCSIFYILYKHFYNFREIAQLLENVVKTVRKELNRVYRANKRSSRLFPISTPLSVGKPIKERVDILLF